MEVVGGVGSAHHLDNDPPIVIVASPYMSNPNGNLSLEILDS